MNRKKLLSLLLCLSMALGLLAGCSGGSSTSGDSSSAGSPSDSASTDAAAQQPADTTPSNTDKTPADTLVVGYSPFNSKFSPFFHETAYDQDATTMTQLALLNSDRTGAVVLKGIEGETIDYNGTPYTYYGPADLTITENADGTVYYDFVMRDGLTFSDGEPMTIDDVIFSIYVFCDPTYDGSTTLFSQPIEGMGAYRAGMDTLFNLLVAAGRDNTDFSLWTEEEQTAFWADLDQAGEKFAQEIIDYCIDAGYADDAAGAAEAWGFSGADAKELFANMCADYEWDLKDLSDTETAGSSLFDLMEHYDNYSKGIKTGESAANISGVQKTGENSLRIVATQVDATMIYQLTLPVAPLHYYGDPSLYDYENNSFGFPKGDLSMARAKTTVPLGAGPYKFVKFENGVINYEANANYFLGEPKTKYVNFVQCIADDDKLNGVVTGTIDITDPSFKTETIAAIEQANGGSLSGSKIVTDTVDNLGYGYLAMSANRMRVGTDGSSEASKNLRKAFGTVLAVYRDVAVDSYYGDRASVINYPISNTSWAAPRPADDGYKVAFSVDIDGNDIYTSSMSAEEKYEAAKQAALGFFEAAGYTVENGKVTAAPEGASLEYTAWIPADGTGDHPSFMLLTEGSNALKDIGITLTIKDLSNSSELWTSLEADQVDMWCAAWGATPDPDMYQIYFSGDATHEPGGSNYMYDIADDDLNQLILDARATTDQAYRKAMYKACLDIIVDWAVEIPVYQRQNAIIFSNERVNMDTVTPDITTFYTWLNEIQNVVMN